MTLSNKSIASLEMTAKEIRQIVLKIIVKAHASHIASAYSIVEILVYIYSYLFHFKLKNNSGGDKFLLSKGWGVSALYAILAQKNIINKKLLKTYCKNGSLLIGIATYNGLPGIDASTGSAGHGFPIGVGMALGMKLNKQRNKVYVLIGDGEMDEGTTWESALIAAHHNLNNLIVIVDYNKWQSFGRTNDVLNLEPLFAKWQSLGWAVQEIDGHNFNEIAHAFGRAIKEGEKPSVIIAHTIKGKGLSSIEDDNTYHYKTPQKRELARAKKEGLL